MLPPALLQDIRALHEGPDRGYHAWSHPAALLAMLSDVASYLHDRDAVECAIVLHDAIYEPLKPDNEKRSAALARVMLAGVVPEETISRTVRMIEATERHEVPDDLSEEDANDVRIFLDMDLSVLGSAESAFDAYEQGVRHEYREVPDAAFNRGRAAILRKFLERERLYLSEWGRARFEEQARKNLRRSLAALAPYADAGAQ
jgi:predicted metal-dependent HD superfamily phosphohydrolase